MAAAPSFLDQLAAEDVAPAVKAAPRSFLDQLADEDAAATQGARPKGRDDVAIGEIYTNEQGQKVIKAKYASLDRYAESPSAGELFGGMGRNLVGGGAHGIGTLVDVATGTSPGEGSYAEKFASPFQGEPTRLDQLDPDQVRWHEMATNALNETIGMGPLAQTVRERVPQAAEAITTVVPLLKTGGGLVTRTGGRIPPSRAPSEPTAGMRRKIPLSASPSESLTAEATGTRGAPYEVPPAAGAPEMPGRPSRAAPLEAQTTGPRAAPYTQLEGDAPPKFVEQTPVAYQGRQLPPEQQMQRARILEKIGIADADIRKSAVTGDAKAAATDYQLSKLDGRNGDHMRQTLDNERAALTNYSERLVNETGGTPGLGETETLQRGQNIVAPLDDLKRYFDDGIRSLYKEADARAGDMPIQTPKTRQILADESEFLGTTEGEALLKGVRARMKSLGIIDAEGNIQATTVKQGERLRQYLGDQWTPRTSRLIRKLKDSIDDDVMSAAGENVYAASRALRETRARILDDPKGIASILDAEGPANINRAVAIEKIPAKVTTLPVAQFEHIGKTLQGVPGELQPQAQAALAEIKAQFANKVHEAGSKTAGQWNAPAVTKYLNANSARMKSVFTPDELQNFATLNDAGHVLRFDTSYPGAAVQQHNLVQSGLMRGFEHTMAAAGGAVAGGPGAAAGSVLGSKITQKIGERSALKAAKARTTKLSDVLKQQETPKK